MNINFLILLYKKRYFVPQYDKMDCGPACLAMIFAFYGRKYPLEFLRENSFISKEGVSLLNIKNAAEKLGMNTFARRLSIEELKNSSKLFPCILHWNQNHFIVLNKIKKKTSGLYVYYISDPAHGVVKIHEDVFSKSWIVENNIGVALFMQPSDEFCKHEIFKEDKIYFRYLLDYVLKFKGKLTMLFFLLLLGSSLTIVFPFLTEFLIDKGVNKKKLDFVFIILIAQLALYLGTITIQILRNWIVLYLGTYLSINIISDFLTKTLQLPIKFFDSKTIGDFNQRIQDNNRVEDFLTTNGLTTIFSIITFSVFLIVLFYYSIVILFAFLGLTILSIIWSLFWLKKRRVLDYHRFQERSENQESIYELLNGVTEMKLNQFENYKIKEWQEIQQRMLNINIRILKIDQLQLSGFEFINQVKNIFITFLSANYVISGTMSLGVLLSISYILGQMNGPVNQMISFVRSLQDAKLSLGRLSEIQNKSPEELNHLKPFVFWKPSSSILKGIKLNNVSFQYEGPMSSYVLKELNFFIPEGKITAIVGASGSGKTTLIKLLLKFYEPSVGEIFYNEDNIMLLSPNSLRENCGVVMQDGYIFSDTIERNIVMGDRNVDREKLEYAVKIANIQAFIEGLPLGYNTKIGASGNGISGGQKQRILIARAVYKDPHYIFFDEATSALDAENERKIHDNLQYFFKGKTVLIIAHRLSTVKNADQIIVLKDGEIVENGNHLDLVRSKKEYYNLVKNQLELGN